MKKFIVVSTPCWPAKWKVILSDSIHQDNSFSNFFQDKIEANKEAERKNNLD